MTEVNEFDQQNSLDPALRTALDADIAQGFATQFLGQALHNLLEQNVVTQGGSVPDQLVAMTTHLIGAIPRDGEDNRILGAHDKTRLLAVVDQLAFYPEATAEYIASQPFQNPVLNPDFLITASVRLYNRGAPASVSVDMLQETLTRFPDDADTAIQAYITGISTALSHGGGVDTVRLQDLLTQTQERFSAIHAEIFAVARPILERASLANQRRQQEHNDRARRTREQDARNAANQQLRERSEQVMTQLRERPAEVYAWLLSEMGIDDVSQVTPEQRDALVEPSSAYMQLQHRGDDWSSIEDDTGRAAIAILRQAFGEATERNRENNSFDSHHFSSHLYDLLPSLYELKEHIAHNPIRARDGKFFQAWRHTKISKELYRRAREKVSPEIAERLKKDGIDHIDLEAIGVEVVYEQLNELLADLHEYFVYTPIEDTLQEEIKHSRLVLDNNIGATVLDSSSRSDGQVLSEDVIDPLNQFLTTLPEQEGEYLFETEESRHRGTPHKYEVTSFGGHAISISVKKLPNGVITYSLRMRGERGYGKEVYNGQRLSAFAAYMGRDVSLTVGPVVGICPTFTLQKQEESGKVNVEQVYSTCNRRPPDAVRQISTRDGSKTINTWYIPQDQRPTLSLIEVVAQGTHQEAANLYVRPNFMGNLVPYDPDVHEPVLSVSERMIDGVSERLVYSRTINALVLPDQPTNDGAEYLFGLAALLALPN